MESRKQKNSLQKRKIKTCCQNNNKTKIYKINQKNIN